VGVITKDTATGPFAEEWKATMEGASKDIEQVDLAFILSNAALAVKDEKELVRHTDQRSLQGPWLTWLLADYS